MAISKLLDGQIVTKKPEQMVKIFKLNLYQRQGKFSENFKVNYLFHYPLKVETSKCCKLRLGDECTV